MIGKTLGHYEIVQPLGAGGMGEVYRARDTKLDRDVAIKVLPEDFATDQDRLARFEREAKLLASLNHANIAAIYGLEDEDDQRFIAMELVEGETLAERIARSGRIDVEEALEIARQIAEALEAAHESGVIHRDLKPANVKVTPDGKVKVLDFGLAKAYETGGSSSDRSPDLSHSPTMMDATRTGVILGTAAYMSPEQARGKPVDKRADIWAFGGVLYEMLTGKRAFEGETVSDTMAAILKEEPKWEQLPDSVPTSATRLLRRCFEKDPRRRLRDIGDARIEIEDALAGAGGDLEPALETAGRQTRLAALVFMGVVVVVLAVAAWAWTRPIPESTLPTRELDMVLPASAPMAFKGSGVIEFRSFDISPDATQLVYAASEEGGGNRLYLRALDDSVALPIEETDGAYMPFFSPDGDSVGFFAEGQLKTVSIDTGLVQVVAAVQNPWGASWGTRDRILVREGNALVWFSTVSADREEMEAQCSMIHRCNLPDLLPGGEWVVVSGARDVAVVSLLTGERRTLRDSLYSPAARALPNGDIAYFQGPGQLHVLPFDASTGTAGAPIPVLDGVRHSARGPQFAVANDGTLVYMEGSYYARGTLTWVTRDGDETPLGFDPQSFLTFDLSPDGRRLAAAVYRTNAQIWIYDLERNTPNPLVTEGFAMNPVWDPDGLQIAFMSRTTAGGWNSPIMVMPASGDGDPQVLVEAGGSPADWYADRLSVGRVGPTSGNDIYVASTATGDIEPFRNESVGEELAYFSPDGSWLVYTELTDRLEVWAERYPRTDYRRQISTGGGASPRWSPEGDEIFFWKEGDILAVDVANGIETSGSPRRLLAGPFERPEGMAFDVHPDGDRFLVVKPSDPRTSSGTVKVVQGWLRGVEEQLRAARR